MEGEKKTRREIKVTSEGKPGKSRESLWSREGKGREQKRERRSKRRKERKEGKKSSRPEGR